ncbi:hypothetical protein TPR58_21190 [Sphingomonas sp. HF-S3]|uniref:Uncharacterized protein n=1 Tax=Sphingomonas rustica TaxID=3103142 RepID=A0ABV0BDS9_9SPHN
MLNEKEMLDRAVTLGQEVLALSDAAGQSLASVHIHTGLEILRTHASAIDTTVNSSTDRP